MNLGTGDDTRTSGGTIRVDRAAKAQPDVDPMDFLRALIRLSPEDARTVRERSPEPAQPDGGEGPFHDYGEDDADQS
ncbi:MAG: hypothetical protein ACJ74U_08420 [Jatrophihabitantaceae bacterium]